jgi:hypothetical protein
MMARTMRLQRRLEARRSAAQAVEAQAVDLPGAQEQAPSPDGAGPTAESLTEGG